MLITRAFLADICSGLTVRAIPMTILSIISYPLLSIIPSDKYLVLAHHLFAMEEGFGEWLFITVFSLSNNPMSIWQYREKLIKIYREIMIYQIDIFHNYQFGMSDYYLCISSFLFYFFFSIMCVTLMFYTSWMHFSSLSKYFFYLAFVHSSKKNSPSHSLSFNLVPFSFTSVKWDKSPPNLQWSILKLRILVLHPLFFKINFSIFVKLLIVFISYLY